ncbi:MAG TPA: RDD family protein, partial [Longimicrobiaceae bacterium]
VHAGGGVLFGAAAAFVFFRVARRGQGRIPRPFRVAFGALGAVVLFAAASSLWGRVFGGDEGEDALEGARVTAAAAGAGGEVGSALSMSAGALRLARADDEAEALAGARGFAEGMRRQGARPEQVREALAAIAEDAEKPWIGAAVAKVTAGLAAAPAAPSPDSLARAYAASLAAGDTAAARALRPGVAAAFAGDTLRGMTQALQAMRAEVRELKEERDEAREGVGLFSFLGRIADELGLGFGWTGLYFTAFLALWRGQTPGKRMMGIRVVRLNGAPITWWAAFERFGGYAASLFTGLLGFFQVAWDRNRQALHDKISETVVVRVPRAGLDS